jgi:hypothetical protein
MMARRFLQIGSFALLGLLSLTALADCPYPKAPAEIPSGSSATEQEMLAAMQAFKAYNEEVKSFQSCLDAESKNKSAAGGQTMQSKAMQAKKLAAAIEELESKAKAFNEQVRIFKSKAG